MTADSEHRHEHFNFVRFTYQNVLTLLLLLATVKLFFPATWENELNAGWMLFLLTLTGVHFVNAFIEFFFHRYVLHMRVFPGLGHFYEKHTAHHQHTVVERTGVYAHNVYPIEENNQLESSFFPWYTFGLFAVTLTPVFILIETLAPSLPIFLAGYSALFMSICIYELLHLTFHWPLATWQALTEKKYLGRFWYTVYTFHLRHHANIRCNESVSGFFGLPIPDLIFGTYVRANTLYPHKKFVEAHEFNPPQPIFLIRWLDTKLYRLSQHSNKNGQ